MSSRSGNFPKSPVRIGGRPFRPPVGLPGGKEDRRGGAIVSLVTHGLIIGLLIAPALMISKRVITRMELGAGGDGPAGGGGGGMRGTGGWQESSAERITYVAPPAPKPAAETPVAETPKLEVVPPPPVPPPTPEVKPEPIIPPVTAPSVAETKSMAPPSGTTVASSAGTGGGTGADGTGGNGPGTGGGVGSGIGTGRGSGIGPGTGGGTQANYPPSPIEMFLPPFPVPDRVRGFHLIAEFEVDEKGKVLSLDFTQTRDGDYNRKLRDILRSIRFRPGTRPDGTPIRMKTQIEYSF
jgi:periplasmic protein TonB